MSWTITGTIVDPDGTPCDGAIVAIVSPTPARSTSGKLIDNDRVPIPVSGGQVDDVALESVPGATWTFLLPRRQRVEIADPGDGAVVNLAADLPAGVPLTPDEASLLRAEIARIKAEGLKGDKGDAGPPGPLGPASTLTVGTVTTGAPGSQAAATLTGTAPNQTLGLTIPQGPQGSAGSPTAFELRGTGMPEGKVTASPGTYYTDTAGTNGAWRWLKKSGTGTTGWDVVSADTGWRDISATSSLPAGLEKSSNYGSYKIRRVGSQVAFVCNLNVTGSSITTLLQVPPGFAGDRKVGIAADPGVLRTAATANAAVGVSNLPGGYFGGNGLSLRIPPLSAPNTVSANYSWVTEDAWPTTLPGTSA